MTVLAYEQSYVNPAPDRFSAMSLLHIFSTWEPTVKEKKIFFKHSDVFKKANLLQLKDWLIKIQIQNLESRSNYPDLQNRLIINTLRKLMLINQFCKCKKLDLDFETSIWVLIS